MDKNLQLALADICELLDNHKIRFALVGGIAASLRGRLRTTEGIDLVLITDIQAALERVGVLSDTPLKPFFYEFERVLRTSYILTLEHQPTGVSLDLAIGVSGFEQQIV